MADDDNVIRVDFGGPRPVEESDYEATPEDREKLTVFSKLVDVGTVLVTLDARHEAASLPAQFGDELKLNLNFCHLFRIPDFEYDERGVRASLSFGGVDHWCDIPWPAVYMMRSHEHEEVQLFPESFPPEMMAFFGALPLSEADEEE